MVVGEGLVDLVARVHHEGSTPGNRLPVGNSCQEQETTPLLDPLDDYLVPPAG